MKANSEHSKYSGKKALIYIRYGTKVQSLKKADLQHEAIVKFCDKHAIQMGTVFSDVCRANEVFGSLNWRILEKCINNHANGIQLIVIASFDRVSRNPVEFIKKQAYLKTLGVSIISSDERTDFSNLLEQSENHLIIQPFNTHNPN